MSTQVERLEHNMAKLTIEVSAEEFEKALQAAYNKQKKSITLPGFRKGKAPRAMVEKMYGAAIFYEEAANIIIPEAYSKAVDESELDIVSRPEIDVVQIEKGQNFIFTAEVAVKPEVTLGDYKGLEVEKTEVVVTDEDVAEELKKEQEKNSRTINVDDRAVAAGDIITFDFDGSIDGTPFEGGKAENYNLTIGSNSFIPGFEDQLIGAEIEKPMDVVVTFPEDYHAAELAGKEAVFACLVHKIEVKELPELDDEFAQDVSEFDTLDEYKADIKKNLTEKKEAEAKTAKENAVVDKAVENAEMDIPQAMIDTQVEQEINQFAQRIQAQGLPFDQYLQFVGGMDALKAQMTEQVVKRIKTRLVLEKIAEVEAIEIADEKVNAEIEEMAKMYNMEADKLMAVMTDVEKTQMKTDMAVQEAVTLITEAAKEA